MTNDNKVFDKSEREFYKDRMGIKRMKKVKAIKKTVAQDLERLIEEFLLGHPNLNTRRNFATDIRAAHAWYNPWLGNEDNLAIVKFVRDQESKGLSRSTIRGRVIRLRKIYEFLVLKGYRAGNPVELSYAPKGKDQRKPRCPTMGELKGLFQALKGESFEHVRDRLIVGLLFYEALRVQEVCDLNVGSFELIKGRYVCEVKGKGGRVDEVFLFPQTEKLLKQYLKLAGKLPAASPLVYSSRRPGQRLTSRGVRKRIDGYFLAAGARKGLSCHSLRHAHATILAARGYPVTGVQKRLRHSSPLTSLKYYYHDEQTAYLPENAHPENLIDFNLGI